MRSLSSPSILAPVTCMDAICVRNPTFDLAGNRAWDSRTPCSGDAASWAGEVGTMLDPKRAFDLLSE